MVMKKHRIFNQGSVFLFAGVIILGILYLGGNSFISGNTGYTKSQSKQEADVNSTVRVVNKVNSLAVISSEKSLAVISAEKKAVNVELIFKNNSEKTIKAFVLRLNETQKSFIQLSDENNIPPGGIHTENFKILQSDNKSPVGILAVVYEDSTGDGDLTTIKDLLDMRLGERIQNEHIYSYLTKISNTPSNNLSQQIEASKEAIRNLSIEDEKNTSEYVKIGLHNAKESALMDMDQLQNVVKDKNDTKIKQQILQLNATYQKKIARQ
jgi:hypothetical protein